MNSMTVPDGAETLGMVAGRAFATATGLCVADAGTRTLARVVTVATQRAGRRRDAYRVAPVVKPVPLSGPAGRRRSIVLELLTGDAG
jgi:hypothetical protein